MYPHSLSFLQSASHSVIQAAELFNIRQSAQLLSQEQIEKRGANVGEKGGMEVSNAAGSRESAGSKKSSGREDGVRL